MKKLISVILSLALMGSLAACGKGGEKEGANGDKIVIELAMHTANVEEQEPAVWAVVQKYMEENEDVEIKITGKELNDHVSSMKMKAESKELPDMFWMTLAPAKEMASAGYLYCIDDFISENGLDQVMADNMLNLMEVDGKHYGLPYQSLVTGFWYNADLFAENNLEVPQTYEDLKAAAEVFSSQGITTIANGAKDPHSVWGMMGLLTHYGFFDHIYEILDGNESYNNDDFRKFYEKLDELRESGAFAENVSTTSYAQAKELFMSGQAAMLDSGSWDANALDSCDFEVGFTWGVSFSDGVGDQNISNMFPHAPLVINAELENEPEKLEAVLDFYQYYYSQEGSWDMIEQMTTPPVSYTGEIPEDFLQEHPTFGKLMDAMAMPDRVSFVCQPNDVSTEGFANALYDSIYGVINGIYSPDEAMDVVQTEIEAGLR